jgi:hypothetical protein
MTTRKYIYLVLGILFIITDILATCIIIVEVNRTFRHIPGYLYFVWEYQVLLLIPGLILLIGAYRVQRKINRKNRMALENAFKD